MSTSRCASSSALSLRSWTPTTPWRSRRTRHYRLLQRIHSPGTGQLSRLLSDADQQAIRRPHPEVLQVLDPRPLLDEAAAIGAAYGSPGLLVGETLAAGLVHGRRLWFGTARNVGKRLAEIADDLGISVHVSEPAAGR